MASSSTHFVDDNTTQVKQIVERRERNGAFEYKVVWKNCFRLPCWRSPSTLDCPDLIQAFDSLLLRINMETARLMAHQKELRPQPRRLKR
ncbi:hypothetical protein DAPPUDRAFT_318343 [Daphnia pulex]|uniref:Chromo domain-containing protein n=1 Tax=Daphnia pulex TaxID=6669 RepID=E9GII7_DAPPU|nr:hypothetical protein DAPPUDRAFT_318343 [Daphnia pulex]|eukprot:EFX80751.1 hypothetical protein DAPPUDRAFT_318343 [Daphnia pulex]